MPWVPIIQNSKEINEIDETIIRIKKVLSHVQEDVPGLHVGTAGSSIFHAYFYKHYGSKECKNLSVEQIRSSLDALTQKKLGFSLCDGILGICWSVLHLAEIGTFKPKPDETITDEINELIMKHARYQFQAGHYDFLYGGIGAGIYLMCHSQNTSVRNEIYEMVHALESTGERHEKGITWPYKIESDIQGYSLGLAHGIPSIITFLSILISNGFRENFVNKLLEDTVNWLLSTKRDSGSFSYFTSIYNYNKPLDDSRLAWCYGDLSVASSIWRAGVCTNNTYWKNEAISIMKHASLRKDIQKNAVLDAGFCHGSVGIAHIFNRFYQETNIEQLKEAAIYWYKVTVNYSRSELENAGFSSYRHNEESGEYREKITNLIEGTAGIGLGLLAAVSNIEPRWDRAFLLS